MDVRVLRHQGQAILVEWLDGEVVRRAVLPPEAIVDGAVDRVALEAGIPYGLPWEELVALRATPESVAAELRRRGIWTLEDLRRQPGVAVAALQACYAVDVSALMRAAEKYKENNHE